MGHLVDDFSTQLPLVASGDVLIPRLARPPFGEELGRAPRRQPNREVHPAWVPSADASPAIQAVLPELTPQPVVP